jgi:glycosyltransferase involved in cell wall biosynthesis
MLHDVIPLQTPEYVVPSAVRAHGRMVDATARHAAGLIVTTLAARAAVLAELQRRGRTDLRILARSLPVGAAFAPRHPAPATSAHSYFVICGAIEPRKNHLLLAEVWKRLVTRLGAAAPHLVVVGELGWSGEAIRQALLRSPLAAGKVHHVAGLPTQDLAELLVGARGLLMPSFIEGFGLPVAEAGALGVPVIASDIGAHREAAPPDTIFLDPIDGPGWEAAIMAATNAPPASRRPAPQAGWDEYFEALEAFVAGGLSSA